jgi:hypothetical protein
MPSQHEHIMAIEKNRRIVFCNLQTNGLTQSAFLNTFIYPLLTLNEKLVRKRILIHLKESRMNIPSLLSERDAYL